MYTASTAFLEALVEAGVSYIFANLGSDHPGLLEALAEANAAGRPAPKIITCPNEMVALSMAQGYAQITERPQAVVVHVECGTQALAGALHNVAKARTPVLIYAGASPFTQEGELRGSRNEFIQWIQDVFDQRGIVRGYTKYDNEIRTGRNVKQVVHRAMQFANSDPKGPVYLMAGREVMEEEIPRISVEAGRWQPISASALPNEAVTDIVSDLRAARRPLVVTSSLGRSHRAFEELVQLARRLSIGVLESVPNYLNFPSDDALYLGNQANEPQNPDLGEADLVLVLDSDVPWIPLRNKPNPSARIIHIDVDPLKEQMPLWYIGAHRVFRADVATALRQINDRLDDVTIDRVGVEERFAHYKARHLARDRELKAREEVVGETVTVPYLTSRVREHVGPDAIILNEGITSYTAIHDHMRCTRPGSIYRSGGGSLGWNGGAAIGMKLACPEKTVVSLTGDGSYMFAVPSSVHWIARQYNTPFLQVVYNNRGWKAPKASMLSVHPDGFGSRAAPGEIGIGFDPPPDYAEIASAAGGAFARTVRRSDELDTALRDALRAIRTEGRSAVLDVWLPPL